MSINVFLFNYLVVILKELIISDKITQQHVLICTKLFLNPTVNWFLKYLFHEYTTNEERPQSEGETGRIKSQKESGPLKEPEAE